ncbi:MAG: flagellar hook-basal body protein [Thermaerobacterales bacterium]
MRSLFIGAAGLTAGQLQTDVIADNFANVNTVGFKRNRAIFAEQMQRRIDRSTRSLAGVPGSEEPIRLGGGTVVQGIRADQRPGQLEVTGEPWHMAIEGRGYFRVGNDDGAVFYTRAGDFRLDGDGRLVTSAGQFLLDDEDEIISIPEDAGTVGISQEGRITARDDNDLEVELARLRLARFVNPVGLQSIGGGLLAVTAASGAAEILEPGDGGAGSIRQGALEQSNVNLSEEMAGLIIAQRAFQLAARVVQSGDQMLGLANRIGG